MMMLLSRNVLMLNFLVWFIDNPLALDLLYHYYCLVVECIPFLLFCLHILSAGTCRLQIEVQSPISFSEKQFHGNTC